MPELQSQDPSPEEVARVVSALTIIEALGKPRPEDTAVPEFMKLMDALNENITTMNRTLSQLNDTVSTLRREMLERGSGRKW